MGANNERQNSLPIQVAVLVLTAFILVAVLHGVSLLYSIQRQHERQQEEFDRRVRERDALIHRMIDWHIAVSTQLETEPVVTAQDLEEIDE